jgi:hypothetical protein
MNFSDISDAFKSYLNGQGNGQNSEMAYVPALKKVIEANMANYRPDMEKAAKDGWTYY